MKKRIILSIVLLSTIGCAIAAPRLFAQSTTIDWFQVTGQVYSRAESNNSISVSLPSATMYFNTLSKAITGSYKSTLVKVGNTADPSRLAPTPMARLEQYTNTAPQVTYAALLARVNPPPSPLPAVNKELFLAQPGIYIDTSPNLIIANDLTIGSAGTPVAVTVFASGKVTIQRNIIVAPGSFFAVFAQDDINIDKTVSQVEGVYHTESKICTACDSAGAPE